MPDLSVVFPLDFLTLAGGGVVAETAGLLPAGEVRLERLAGTVEGSMPGRRVDPLPFTGRECCSQGHVDKDAAKMGFGGARLLRVAAL